MPSTDQGGTGEAMRDLRLIGVHEDGQHLLLSDNEGERFRVELDEPLRAAVRRDRPRLGQLQIEIDGGMRPREVQALIRAGYSAAEVAERSGWTVEKVARYEGPILAEREYVAGLARTVRVRARGGSGQQATTLAARVSQRLSGRGVDPGLAEWDSARNDSGEWTVILTFPAGGRERQARWAFDVQARTVTAVDDEARWLSEEEAATPASPLPAPHLVSAPARATTVYDVEAEGGVASPRRQAAPPVPEEPLDLMSAMRERAAHRGRPRRRRSSPAATPVDEAPREDALPLEDFAYDPETMAPPPAAKGPHPLDEDAGEVGHDVLPAAYTSPEDRPDPSRGRGTAPGPDAPSAAEVQETDGPAEPGRRVPGDREKAKPAQPAAQDRAQPESEPTSGREPESETAPRPRPARRRAGRPSVPSWDDVMFGAKPRE
ncbi:septation protein SepH [Phycicoccus sp. M110.8]|uniref:septation protein SepH n=1 Tax=Phycicoccus sp. M110.8 TaxID=3075433 RepID=UPI0028FD01F8|nr:septation protein SepH [Phycicoccus sp. M110.8]MDU0315205.1 septation protein SepH [Phycicoccus sp. M110.8]